jgi:hypothetical protein
VNQRQVNGLLLGNPVLIFAGAGINPQHVTDINEQGNLNHGT